MGWHNLNDVTNKINPFSLAMIFPLILNIGLSFQAWLWGNNFLMVTIMKPLCNMTMTYCKGLCDVLLCYYCGVHGWGGKCHFVDVIVLLVMPTRQQDTHGNCSISLDVMDVSSPQPQLLAGPSHRGHHPRCHSVTQGQRGAKCSDKLSRPQVIWLA